MVRTKREERKTRGLLRFFSARFREDAKLEMTAVKNKE